MSDVELLGCERGRRGKIARLPLAIREEVCRRISDGESGASICGWLNGQTAVKAVCEREFQGIPVSEDNVSRWRVGGFLAWQRHRESLEAVELLSDESGELQEKVKDGLTHRLAVVLCGRMAIQLQRFEEMAEGEKKDRLWRELVFGLVLLRRGDLQADRIRNERERFEYRRFRGPAEMEAAFLKWASMPENLARVRSALFPDDKLTEKERKKKRVERVHAIKSRLGV